MRLALALLLLSFPALANGPDLTLLEKRDIALDCKGEACTLLKTDLQWIFARDQLMSSLLEEAMSQLRTCKFKRA